MPEEIPWIYFLRLRTSFFVCFCKAHWGNRIENAYHRPPRYRYKTCTTCPGHSDHTSFQMTLHYDNAGATVSYLHL